MINSLPTLHKLDQRSLKNFRQNLSNKIVHSRLNHLERTESDSGLSLKMVVDGVENYTIEGHQYQLQSGKYLLVNRHQQFESHIRCENVNVVEGVCIYLDEDMVRDTIRTLTSSDEELLDYPFEADGTKLEFVEKTYSLEEPDLGPYLQWIVNTIRKDPEGLPLTGDFIFRQIAEKLVISQSKVRRQIAQIQTEKASTRWELYRRLSMARQYLEEHLSDKVELKDVCRHAALSESHFLRTFRQAFGISPYKYLIKRRLEQSARLLETGIYSVSEVASRSGFSDIFSFSKAFKKEFSVSPSKWGLFKTA